MKVIALLLMAVALSLSACAGEAESYEYALCPCAEPGGCSTYACRYQLSLHPECDGKVSFAEVLIDGVLEEEAILVDTPLIPCMRTEPGKSAVIWVRGGAWIWGPLNKECPLTGHQPDEAHSLVFECEEAGGS